MCCTPITSSTTQRYRPPSATQRVLQNRADSPHSICGHFRHEQKDPDHIGFNCTKVGIAPDRGSGAPSFGGLHIKTADKFKQNSTSSTARLLHLARGVVPPNNVDPGTNPNAYVFALSPCGFRGLKGVAAIATHVALAEGGCWYPCLSFALF